MQDNKFKKSLEIPVSRQPMQKSKIDNQSTEALYLYTNKALNEIFYFLLNFYRENPTQEMKESEYVKSSHAESYYYSLREELSYAHNNLDMENFEGRFNNICSHYKTNPLEIYKIYDLIMQAKEKPQEKDFQSIIDEIEVEVNEHWVKMKEERNNRDK